MTDQKSIIGKDMSTMHHTTVRFLNIEKIQLVSEEKFNRKIAIYSKKIQST